MAGRLLQIKYVCAFAAIYAFQHGCYNSTHMNADELNACLSIVILSVDSRLNLPHDQTDTSKRTQTFNRPWTSIQATSSQHAKHTHVHTTKG